MIRYGILSTAQVVPRFVAGVKESKNGEVVAIASRDLTKAQKAATELNIPQAFGSYQALVDSPEVDIVYIAVYNQGHYDAAKLALKAGKHVLLEKPFVLKSPEAQELFALAESKNLFLMEAQKSLFLPITQQVKKWLTEEKIGQLHWLESVTAYPNIRHIDWFFDVAAGGGILNGAGGYPLEYMQYLLEETPQEVVGTLNFQPGEADHQANLALRFKNDISASIFLTVDLDLPRSLTLHGTQGKIWIPDFWRAEQAVISFNDGTTETAELPILVSLSMKWTTSMTVWHNIY